MSLVCDLAMTQPALICTKQFTLLAFTEVIVAPVDSISAYPLKWIDRDFILKEISTINHTLFHYFIL
uniref:Uncharacterized protein n=1 Tax=Anguilla anguilla TaxID=7936 RepID=A0A0E9WXG1_ANGAN